MSVDIQRVSEENELWVLFLVPVDDAPDLLRVLQPCLFIVHIISDGIGQRALGSMFSKHEVIGLASRCLG